MDRITGIQIPLIIVALLPLMFAPVPTEASGKSSDGSKAGRQDDASQMWQAQQGGSGESGKHKQNGQRRIESREQNKTRTKIRHRVRDDDIYGREMMTQREMERYRKQLDSARSDREWARLRAEHQRQMTQRASERGVALDPPTYGQHMMTREERLRFERRLASATTTEQRERIRNEHRMMIEQRASELGLELLRPAEAE